MAKVFAWGLQAHLKTGKANICEKWLVPTCVPLPRNATEPVECAAGTHCYFVRTTTGQVYSWGRGTYGRLGHGGDGDTLRPRRIAGLPDNVQRIFADNLNVGIIDANGQAHVWGHMLKESTPTLITFPNRDNVTVTKICPGMRTCLFLTSDGEVFGMGANSQLQCGVSAKRFGIFIESPRRIMPRLTERIIDISLGALNGIALTETGRIFMWGSNRHGQMGLGVRDGKKYRPREVDVSRILGRLPPAASANVDADSDSPPDDDAPQQRITSVFLSLSDNYIHAGCILHSGRAIFWGSNYKGKLATGDTTAHLTPHLSPHLAGCVRLFPGGIHNMALCENSNLLSFGCGSDGRLGHPEAAGHRYLFKEYIPRLIEPIRGRVRDAAASYYAGIAVVMAVGERSRGVDPTEEEEEGEEKEGEGD